MERVTGYFSQAGAAYFSDVLFKYEVRVSYLTCKKEIIEYVQEIIPSKSKANIDGERCRLVMQVKDEGENNRSHSYSLYD